MRDVVAAIGTLEILPGASGHALTSCAAKKIYPAIDPLQHVLGKLLEVHLTMARADYERGVSQPAV